MDKNTFEFKVAICDNNREIRNFVKEYVSEYFKQKRIVLKCIEFSDGKYFLESKEVFNLVILDIIMEHTNGLKVRDELFFNRIDTKIIFFTDYEEFKDEAYGKNVFGYIIKNKIHSLKKIMNVIISEYIDHYIIKIANQIIDVYKIMYIKSGGVYCSLYMINSEEILIRKGLSEVESLLKEHYFVRVQKSYLVNLRYIKMCNLTRVTMRDNRSINLSRKINKEVKQEYFNYIKNVIYGNI